MWSYKDSKLFVQSKPSCMFKVGGRFDRLCNYWPYYLHFSNFFKKFAN